MMASEGDDVERGLRSVLWSLRAFLKDLVLIGGWVPELYRRYGGFAEWRAELSGTTELDLLVVPPLTHEGGETLADLLRQAGFEERAAGAVWEGGDPAGRIEFMTPHQGTARAQGKVVRVEGQGGLGALALEGLGILAAFCTELRVPVGRDGDVAQSVGVRVPTLGAYVLNKALTFPYRPEEPGDGGDPKKAKDILYLRDLMAAGDEVVGRIEADLRDVADAGYDNEIERARSNIYLVLHGGMRRHLSEAATVLSEREGMRRTAAEADLEGHLTDLQEVLQAAL